MPSPQLVAITTKIKANFLDRAKFKALLGEANQIALTKCGVRIRDAAKKGIGNAAPHVSKSKRQKAKPGDLQQFGDGLYKDLSSTNAGKKARDPGKPIKSWAPRRFVYRDIKFYWDGASEAVVIGPYRAGWLNRLHEFGGSERLFAVSIGDTAARRARAIQRRGGQIGKTARGDLDVGVVRWVSAGSKSSRNWRQIGMAKTARYPARPFMQGSAYVHKALDRIARDFKDTLNAKAGEGMGPTVAG